MFSLFPRMYFQVQNVCFRCKFEGKFRSWPTKSSRSQQKASFLETFLAPSFFLAFSRKLGAKYKMKAGLAATKKHQPEPCVSAGN